MLLRGIFSLGSKFENRIVGTRLFCVAIEIFLGATFFRQVKSNPLNYRNWTRTNLCARATSVFNGSIPLNRGLENMKITVAVHANTPSFYMSVNATNGIPTGGFMFALEKEIQKRGSFEFEYVLVPNIPTGMSWTTRLNQILPHLDMYANNFYSDTVERRSGGLGFSQQILDASVIFITPISQTRQRAEVNFTFVLPFTWKMWACVLAVVLGNGLVSWAINPTVHRNKKVTLFRTLYSSWGTFTGKEDKSPEKPAGSILNAGFAFFLVIVVSCYTANIASIYIGQQSATLSLTSIDAANTLRAPVCALMGTTAASVVQTAYSKVKLVPIPGNSPSSLLKAIDNNQCAGAVMPITDWNLCQVDKNVNHGCRFQQAGPTVRSISGAWPYKLDFSVACTSFLNAVISDIITEMMADGSLDAMHAAAVASASTVDCNSDSMAAGPSLQVDVADISGLIWIYIAAICLALLVHFQSQLRAWLISKGYYYDSALDSLSSAGSNFASVDGFDADADADGQSSDGMCDKDDSHVSNLDKRERIHKNTQNIDDVNDGIISSKPSLKQGTRAVEATSSLSVFSLTIDDGPYKAEGKGGERGGERTGAGLSYEQIYAADDVKANGGQRDSDRLTSHTAVSLNSSSSSTRKHRMTDSSRPVYSVGHESHSQRFAIDVAGLSKVGYSGARSTAEVVSHGHGDCKRHHDDSSESDYDDIECSTPASVKTIHRGPRPQHNSDESPIPSLSAGNDHSVVTNSKPSPGGPSGGRRINTLRSPQPSAIVRASATATNSSR